MLSAALAVYDAIAPSMPFPVRSLLRPVPLLTLATLALLLVLFGRSLSSEVPALHDAPTQSGSTPSAPSPDWRALQEESARWMPDELEEVRLGMPEASLRRLRSRLRPDVAKRRSTPEPYRWLVEPSEHGGEVRYAIFLSSPRLVRIQVLSRLPHLPALQAHLAAMNDRYGSASGVWRCDTGDGVPTLRFTWRGHRVALADILLIHPGGISVTLDIAPATLIERSLRLGGCRPATPKDLNAPPPMADPAALRSLAGNRAAPTGGPH